MADKKSILIVDDDPIYAKMVREWTKDYYQAFVVVSGEQTIRFLTKHTVDMILFGLRNADNERYSDSRAYQGE